MKITSEEELKQVLDKLAPILLEAWKVAVMAIALCKIHDTRKTVDTNEVGTGDTTK